MIQGNINNNFIIASRAYLLQLGLSIIRGIGDDDALPVVQVKTALWEWRWRERRFKHRGSSLEVEDGVSEPAGQRDRHQILIGFDTLTYRKLLRSPILVGYHGASSKHARRSGAVKEICPRGNNKVVIYISLYRDKCLLFMLELY